MLLALAAISLAWANYRLKMLAWWGVFLWWTGWMVSGMLTVANAASVRRLYENFGTPPNHVELFQRAGLFDAISNMQWIVALTALATLFYLLYVRRYFVRGDAGWSAS